MAGKTGSSAMSTTVKPPAPATGSGLLAGAAAPAIAAHSLVDCTANSHTNARRPPFFSAFSQQHLDHPLRAQRLIAGG